MSYILDALKKSEQERGRGNIPGVQTVHSSSINYTSKKTVWPYFLIAAVLLNLAAILYFILDRENPAATDNNEQQPVSIKAVGETQPQMQNTRVNATAEQVSPPVETPGAASRQNAETASSFIPDKQPAPAERQQPSARQATVIAEAGSRENNNYAQESGTITENRTTADASNIIEFYELPESTKQQLPSIVITAHVYSTNPQQRSIVVNNNFMEEGEYFLDGLILDEITPDGAIFTYQDIKFHLGVVSGWQ